MATATRNQKKLYLLDSYVQEITGAKLPSNKQALGYFLYLHREQSYPIRKAAALTIEKIFIFWQKASIPVKQKQNAIIKLEKFFRKWQTLQKHKTRKSVTQAEQEETFKECLDDLFDIAHAQALTMITNEEDKEFLLAQREKGRRGCMAELDVTAVRKLKRRQIALDKSTKRRRRAEEEASQSSAVAYLEDSSCSSTEDDSIVEDDYCPKATSRSSQNMLLSEKNQKKLVTPNLSSGLDRTNVTDRAAMMIISETAKSLGHDINEFTLSVSSIRRNRRNHRKELATEILKSFSTDSPLTVHWDGKLLPDLTGSENVDRLPILVSADGKAQLLSVPKLPSGTGEAQAHAIFKALKEWNVQDSVEAMCFDTTSSNTGRINGACVIIEQLLCRDLLHLACRHHILELIAGAAFKTVVTSSSAPEIQLFKRFRDHWEFIDQAKYEDACTDDITASGIEDVKEELIHFIESALLTKQPRSDYKELLELALLFLGASPSQKIQFKAPGANHHARWMAKIIYSFKIWMFRKQFKLTAREQTGLRDLCLFFSRIYVKAWITAPAATKAPNSDLHLLQALNQYKSINEAISSATTEKMMRHLWYLSEELVGLALFDDDVMPSMKEEIVHAMLSTEEKDTPAKKATISPGSVSSQSLSSLATSNTRLLFKKLKLPNSFLQLPVSQWENNRDYQTAKAFCTSLAVTNDHAERSVALVQTYSGCLTKDEEQLQYLLQVVSQHRKNMPQTLKHTLAE